MAAASIAVLRTAESAAALLQPSRLRMLEELRAPNSAAGIARILELPRQVVNYHLRELEKAGLVEEVETRRKGNCLERIVRATAHSYLVSPEVLGHLGASPEEQRDRFSVTYLMAAAGRIIRDLANIDVRARRAGKRVATLTLEAEVAFASPQDRNTFAEEFATTLARLAARYHAPSVKSARRFRFIVCGLPVITKGEEQDVSTHTLTGEA